MVFNKKDILTGFLIIVVIIAGLFLYKKLKSPKNVILDSDNSELVDEFKDVFKYEIPDNVVSIDLVNVNGDSARGIATDNEVLIDAEDPQNGYFYQAWLKNPNDQTLVSLGKFRTAKGGWILEYNRNNYSEYNKLIVSLEKIFDKNLEKPILEGTF